MTWEARPRSEFGNLSAIVSGTGRPVVLVHGVGLRAEAWNRQIDALSLDMRVTAVDLPGHGHSQMQSDAPELSDFTDAVAAAIAEPAMIVGHSMGAMIALDLASRFPDRVSGVAALNAIFQRSPAAVAAVEARVNSLDGVSRADPSSTLDRWFGTKPSPERDACNKWLRDVDPAAYRAAYCVFASSDGTDRKKLSSLGCAAMFATGADEPNSTPDMSREMARLVPDARLAIIDGAAHMMPMTHPDDVNRVLVDFSKTVLP